MILEQRLAAMLEQHPRRRSPNLSIGLGQRAHSTSTTMTMVHTTTDQWLTIWTPDLVESDVTSLSHNTGRKDPSRHTWTGIEGPRPSEFPEMTNSSRIFDLAKIIISCMPKQLQESSQLDTKNPFQESTKWIILPRFSSNLNHPWLCYLLYTYNN